MKCERVRDALAAYVDGDCGPLLRRRIERHLTTCSGCAEMLGDERSLRVALSAWSDEEPSADVWPRLRAMAAPALVASVEPPAPTWRTFGQALGRRAIPYLLGAATAVAVMVGVGFEQRPVGRDAGPGETLDAWSGPLSPVFHDDSPPTHGRETVRIDPVSGTVRTRYLPRAGGETAGDAPFQSLVIDRLRSDESNPAPGVTAVTHRRPPRRTH